MTATPPPAPTHESDGVPADIAAYDVARALLKRGRFDEAAQAFAAFLQEHPRSLLTTEARVSIVDATFRARRFEDVVRLVDDALASKSHALRGGDLVRVKADALANVKRCDAADAAFTEALTLGARQLTPADVRAALVACRRP